MNDQVLKDYEEYKAQGRIWGGVLPERIARISENGTSRRGLAA
jgi:hypothetical protein